MIRFFQVHIFFSVNERDQFRPVCSGDTRDEIAIAIGIANALC